MFDAPVGVVLVVVHNTSGEIVMTRQPQWPEGFWGLVAGFVEDGERAEVAAAREVKEETGLDVQIDGFLGTYTDPRIPGRLMIAFSARVLGGELRAGDDVSEARFFDTRSAPLPMGWPAALAVERFLAGSSRSSHLSRCMQSPV